VLVNRERCGAFLHDDPTLMQPVGFVEGILNLPDFGVLGHVNLLS
jgi:hypothetical protein